MSERDLHDALQVSWCKMISLIDLGSVALD